MTLSITHLIINFVSPLVINSNLLIPPPTMSVPPLQLQGQEHRAKSYKDSNTIANINTVLASWYGSDFHGGQTASGEIYNQYDMTAAHPYLPFGTILEVSYRGRSVTVRVNDRGPYEGSRGLDLSRAAAEELGLIDVGVDYVNVY